MAHILPRKMSIMVVFGVFICAFVASEYSFGQGMGGYGSSDPRDYQDNRGGQGDDGRQAPLTRQEKARQDILDSGRMIDQTLVNFLNMINDQLKPTPQQVDDAIVLVTKGRKYNKQFSDALNTEVLMLQAWTEYFGGDLTKAQLYSKNAYASKEGRTNKDAHATHIAMSLVSGRKPYVLPTPRRNSRTNTTGASGGYNRGGDPYGGNRGNQPNPGYQQNNGMQMGGNLNASAGNILDFDAESLDMELVGQTVGPMKLRCVNSTSFDYSPSQSNLCILFWQASSKNTPGISSGEPNNLSTRGGRPGSSTGGYNQGNYNQGGYNQGGYGRADGRSEYGRGDERSNYGGGYGRGDERSNYGGGYGSDGREYDRSYQESSYPSGGGYGMPQPKGDPFTLQTAAYATMFGSQMTNPQIKFLGINTDTAANSTAAVGKLLKSPMPWANVMAANPASGAAQYASMDCTTPKMVVVDRTGKIRYAGPATGFLGPMVMNHLAGEAVGSLPTRSPVASASASTGGLGALKNLFSGGASTTTTTTTTTARPATSDVPATTTPPKDEEQELASSIQAQRLLEYAKMFVSAGRKPILTSKVGVEKCREILEKYPNTKEAQEARLLLRRVPERERKLYKITDAEMGY